MCWHTPHKPAQLGDTHAASTHLVGTWGHLFPLAFSPLFPILLLRETHLSEDKAESLPLGDPKRSHLDSELPDQDHHRGVGEYFGDVVMEIAGHHLPSPRGVL